jgi:hypothetical protein
LQRRPGRKCAAVVHGGAGGGEGQERDYAEDDPDTASRVFDKRMARKHFRPRFAGAQAKNAA